MKAAFQTSLTTTGNTVLSGSPNVKINGLPVARMTDPVSGMSVMITVGSPNIKVNNLPLARIGDPTVTDTIATGATNVTANG